MKTIICGDVNGNRTEVPVDQLEWRPSVYGIVVDEDKILIQPTISGYWFPGGGMEIGETIEQALKREFWEETGLEVEPIGIVHAESIFFQMIVSRKFRNFILIFYLCKIVNGTLTTQYFEEREKETTSMSEWLPTAEAKKLKYVYPINCEEVIDKAMGVSKCVNI